MPSKIEWTEQTWNPIVGCSIISTGCRECYAMRQAHRLASNPATPHYAGTTKLVKGKPVWTGKLAQAPESVLTAPLRRKKPTMYFVNSMSDLFHEDMPDEWIDRVFAVMALAPQHTFQVLTKRAGRMRAWFNGDGRDRWEDHVYPRAYALSAVHQRPVGSMWPLPNVWLGCSVEDQKRADERIPDLLETPAAVRWLSVEPMLGPVDLSGCIDTVMTRQIDWVVCGGESGPNARPLHIWWVESILTQCAEADVACFVKQLGARPYRHPEHTGATKGHSLSLKDKKGGDMSEWPSDLRVREYPQCGT